jgi:disulfide bond formation protein DsbB
MEKMYKKISTIVKNIFQNYFELTVTFSALLIIATAILMDQFMYLQACALCILTRYVFGLVAVSGLLGYLFRKQFVSAILISASSLIGLFVTSRQIYIQNMSFDELLSLSGCGMPFHAQVDYFGLIEAINRTLAGGPSCAEDGWRFIFNFAEYGFIFFATYLIATVFKYRGLIKLA